MVRGKGRSAHDLSPPPITSLGDRVQSRTGSCRFQPAVPAGQFAGAVDEGADVFGGLAGPPQQRPRVPRRRSHQRPPHHPGHGRHTRGRRAEHAPARTTRSTEARMLSTVPRYRVGVKPTERHSSITNWLNSGARASSANSSGSAASPATGTAGIAAKRCPSATSTPERIQPEQLGRHASSGPASPARSPHPAARPAAARTARAPPPRPDGSPTRDTTAAPRAGSTASSRSWHPRSPPAGSAPTAAARCAEIAARSTCARICRASIRNTAPAGLNRT